MRITSAVCACALILAALAAGCSPRDSSGTGTTATPSAATPPASAASR